MQWIKLIRMVEARIRGRCFNALTSLLSRWERKPKMLATKIG
jgi:hypothetical protein